MKKTITLIVATLLISICCFSQAPSWSWAKGAVTPSGGTGAAVNTTVDKDGNVYEIGGFHDQSILFGTSVLYNHNWTNNDMYLVKYDPSGNVLWALDEGGNFGEGGRAVTTDTSGNVIVSGIFDGVMTIGSNYLTNLNNSRDIFIVKYNSSGSVLWVQSGGSNFDDVATSISTDQSGNIYLTGKCNGDSLYFGSTFLINPGNAFLFVIKLDSNGNVLWAKNSKGATGFSTANDITTSVSGNTYVVGDLIGPQLIFGTDTIVHGNMGYNSAFILKYDSNGNEIYLKRDEIGISSATSIAIDNDENIYVTGSFVDSTVTCGTIVLTNSMFPSYYDVFTVKYDSSGNVLWAKGMGSTNDEEANDIVADANGNVYVTGYFGSSSIPFGSSVLTSSSLPFNVTADIFVIGYDTFGNELWGKSAGGANYTAIGKSISINSSGGVYVTGFFSSDSIKFGSISLINFGNVGPFMAKLDLTTSISKNDLQSEISVSPNPFSSQTTISFSEEQKNTTIKITDVLGKEIKTIHFSGKECIIEKGEMERGVYFVQITEEQKKTDNKKIIIQ